MLILKISPVLFYIVSLMSMIIIPMDLHIGIYLITFLILKKQKKHVEYLQRHSRVGKKYPDNFEIIEVKIDDFNSWSEGFEELTK